MAGPNPTTYRRNPVDPQWREEIDVSSANAVFTQPTVGIYVGVTGNVAFIDEGNTSRVMTNLAAGFTHRLAASTILTTGTTADELVAVW